MIDQNREALVQRALLLECVTLAWVTLEAGVSIYAAIAAHSTSLLAFGIDSLIEAASACVLLWRLNVELRRGEHFSEKIERQASRISGALLLNLAAYVVVIAAWSLWRGEGQEFTVIGLVITAVTIPIMYVLARQKLAIAGQTGSRALRADAMESLTCGWLSTVIVIGLVAEYLVGAWWLDSITSLVIVWFLVREGREAWSGEECCAECH